MPRVSREQSEQNRIAIEEAASRLFREQGFKGVSVSDLMGGAGLTHGGFYGHFESKDELAAIACERAFDESIDCWDGRIASHADKQDALAAVVNGYLSTRTRDDAGISCPASAWAGDVVREDAQSPVRAAYVRGVKGLLARLLRLSDAAPVAGQHAATAVTKASAKASAKAEAKAQAEARAEAEQQALLRMITLVGALNLARATAGDPLSDQILKVARAALLQAD